MKPLVVSLVLLVAAIAARADSISVPEIIQNSGSTEVSILGDPTVMPTYPMSQYHSLGGPYLQFYVAAFPAGIGTMTFSVDGITKTVEIDTAGMGFVQGFNIPRNLYHPTPATLTLSIDGITKSYEFNVATPVPEPSTLVMLAGGLGLLLLQYWNPFHTRRPGAN
jgi:hypothetical protein